MASIEKRGENSYRIIVSKPKIKGNGYDKAYKTITFPSNMTENQRKKEIDKAAFYLRSQ